MPRYWFLFVGIFFFVRLCALGQDAPVGAATKTKVESTSIKKVISRLLVREKLKPAKIAIGINTKWGIASLVNAELDILEGSLQFFLSNTFLLQWDLGFSYRRRVSSFPRSSFTYYNRGWFSRYGLFYNFLHQNSSDYGIWAGLQYAHTFYNHKIIFLREVEPRIPQKFEERNLNARWLTFNAGIQIALNKYIAMGASVEAIFLLRPPERNTPLVSSEIPGYGVFSGTFRVGWQHYFRFTLPFRR